MLSEVDKNGIIVVNVYVPFTSIKLIPDIVICVVVMVRLLEFDTPDMLFVA